MREKNIIEGFLEKYGFKYDGVCNCDGIRTEKYKSPSFRLRVRKLRFKIKGHTNWLPISELVEKIQSLHKCSCSSIN